MVVGPLSRSTILATVISFHPQLPPAFASGRRHLVPPSSPLSNRSILNLFPFIALSTTIILFQNPLVPPSYHFSIHNSLSRPTAIPFFQHPFKTEINTPAKPGDTTNGPVNLFARSMLGWSNRGFVVSISCQTQGNFVTSTVYVLMMFFRPTGG